jgi:hypothetical protein
MKTLFSLITFVFVTTISMNAQNIKFNSLEINYGTVNKDSDGVRVFKFTNTGKLPLIINNAQGSCGCTVPTYPKEPIMPGEISEIRVKYDTNRIGQFTKFVTLTTNAIDNSTVQLKISGEVKS